MAVLLLAVAGGILTCLLNEVDEPRSIASSLSSLLFVILVGRWMYFDNQQYDLRGMRYWYLGVLCCALFAVPAYFFTTRGWKGWLPIWASLGTLVAYGMVNVVTVLLVESLLPS